jgi:hypothetical protein
MPLASLEGAPLVPCSGQRAMPSASATAFRAFTELGLYSTDKELVVKVLQSVGRRLTKLLLGDIDKHLCLSKILQLCPNLVQVHWKMEYFEVDDSYVPWPEDVTLSCLQQVRLVMEHEPPLHRQGQCNFYISSKSKSVGAN